MLHKPLTDPLATKWGELAPALIERANYAFAMIVLEQDGQRDKVRTMKAGSRLGANGLQTRVRDHYASNWGKVVTHLDDPRDQSAVDGAASVLSTMSDHGLLCVRVAPRGHAVYIASWGELPIVEAAARRLGE